MKLYELSNSFSELFEQYEAINGYEPDKDKDGRYIDDDGNVIANIEAFRAEMIQAWFDTLTGIEEAFEDKAENIAAYIKDIQADIEAMKTEKRKLEERIKAKDNAVENLKNYLLSEMSMVNIKKIDRPRARITFNAGRQSVSVLSTESFIKWAQDNDREDLLIYRQPEVSKSAVMADLLAGKPVEFAEVVRKPYITIK